MDKSTSEKRVPWSDIQTYLDCNSKIESLFKCMNDGTLDYKDIEKKIGKPLVELHKAIKSILLNNSLIENDSDQFKSKMMTII